MKVEFNGTTATTGRAARASRISVTEKLDAPLLMVASVVPSGDNASPNGFGAPTSISTPAGVRTRPLGRIAAGRPSMVVAVVAGRSPAGARKRKNSDGAPAPAHAVADTASASSPARRLVSQVIAGPPAGSQ